MNDLKELYQDLIIDHNHNPRNHYKLSDATASAKGYNPLCGDKIDVYLKLNHNRIENISFEGVGCAISQASASMMTEAVKSKTITEAKLLTEEVKSMLIGKDTTKHDKLIALAGVKDYPVRVKCATLAWHTLIAALDHKQNQVSTE